MSSLFSIAACQDTSRTRTRGFTSMGNARSVSAIPAMLSMFWKPAASRRAGSSAGRGVERASREPLLGRDARPGHRRDAAEREPDVPRDAALDLRRGGDRNEREAPRLAVHRLEISAATRERALGNAHLGDQLART